MVEDEARLADAIARGLRVEGMAVDLAFDGHQALEKISANDYDVVVLDRDLPVIHGDEVCRRLVADGGHQRVLMLTAAGGVPERIAGLNLGADDYLGKPFVFGELVARVRSLGRRAAPAVASILRAGDIEVDSPRRLAHRGGQRLNLTRKELAVLEILLAANGSVVSAEQLLERVWDEHADRACQNFCVRA